MKLRLKRFLLFAQTIFFISLITFAFAASACAQGDKWKLIKHIGTFSGCDVGVIEYIVDKETAVPCVVQIILVNEIFVAQTGTPLYDVVVYDKDNVEDGGFTRLQTACDTGMLSDKDILDISRRFNELDGPAVRFEGDRLIVDGMLGTVNFYGLTQKQVLGITKAYRGAVYPDGGVPVQDIAVTQNLGVYGGYIAVQIYDDNKDGGEKYDYSVGGVTICEENASLSLWLYGDGELVPLDKAYADGLVSLSDIAGMASLYIS